LSVILSHWSWWLQGRFSGCSTSDSRLSRCRRSNGCSGHIADSAVMQEPKKNAAPPSPHGRLGIADRLRGRRAVLCETPATPAPTFPRSPPLPS
jgi:hypothetical protein